MANSFMRGPWDVGAEYPHITYMDRQVPQKALVDAARALLLTRRPHAPSRFTAQRPASVIPPPRSIAKVHGLCLRVDVPLLIINDHVEP